MRTLIWGSIGIAAGVLVLALAYGVSWLTFIACERIDKAVMRRRQR